MGGRLGLKLRMVANEYATVVAVALVVLTLAGGGLIYATYADPGTETREEVVAEWQTTSGYTHSATVVNGTTVFPSGSTLSDRGVYYTRISPVLDAEFRYGFDAPDGSLTVEGQTTLVIRSVGEGGEDSDPPVFWQREERLSTFSETLAPGESVTSTASVDVQAAIEDIETIESELGASPGTTEIRLRSSITANGEVAGESESREATRILTLEPGGGTYSVETPAPETERYQQTRQVTTERTYGPVRLAAGPVLVVVGVFGLGGFALAYRRDYFEVTDVERRSLEFANRRNDLDEWISRGRIDHETTEGDRERVRIDTLDDLVASAIDTDGCVIEDTERGQYYVLDGPRRYVYKPDPKIDIERFRS
jgi:hypothetical protein